MIIGEIFSSCSQIFLSHRIVLIFFSKCQKFKADAFFPGVVPKFNIHDFCTVGGGFLDFGGGSPGTSPERPDPDPEKVSHFIKIDDFGAPSFATGLTWAARWTSFPYFITMGKIKYRASNAVVTRLSGRKSVWNR